MLKNRHVEGGSKTLPYRGICLSRSKLQLIVLGCINKPGGSIGAAGLWYVWRESNIQQLAVDLQRAVGVMGQNLLGQDLTELHTLLVEGVQVPRKALEHHLVLEVGQQSAQGGGGNVSKIVPSKSKITS